MCKKTKTTKVTYDFDQSGQRIGETTIETEDLIEPISDDYEVETGVELDGIVDVSPLQTLMLALAGGVLGAMLYKAFNKD